MLVIFPALVAGIVMMFAMIGIFIAIVAICKIGLSLVCIRCREKKWGYLWIPFIYGWFEGAVVSRFLSKGKKSKIFQGLWMVLHAAMIILPYTTLFIDIEYNDKNFALINDITRYISFSIAVILTIVRIIAMKRTGKTWKNAILIGILAQDFWTFFMIKDAKKYRD